MNTKRTHQVTFRLSDEELALLKDKITSSGINQQEYLRRVALNKKIINMDGLKEIFPEMKRQGVNLNQIAKKLNERQFVDYDQELGSTLKEVKETWQSLRRFLAMHR